MFCLSPTKTKKKGEQCLKKQIRVTSSTCTDYFNQWQHPPPPKLHKCGRCMFFYIYKKGSCLTLECIKGCSCTWSLLFPLVLESSCMSCGGTLVFILSFSTFSTHMNRRRTAPPPPPKHTLPVTRRPAETLSNSEAGRGASSNGGSRHLLEGLPFPSPLLQVSREVLQGL